MYGLVNQGIKDMVVECHGGESWERICADASIAIDDFELLKTYPDALTYGLVGGACRILSVEAGAFLEQFGEYWIRFTAEKGYGDLLKLFGSDLRSCLRNLNHMHARMGAMMPDLRPPRFIVEEEEPARIELRYFSKRDGLAPMVVGLIRGLAHRYGNEISITHHPRPENRDHEHFTVVLLR